MNFYQVVDTCLAFSKANGGTIATYPVGHSKLEIHSRTTRTEILVDQTAPGQWLVTLKQSAAGDNCEINETVSTQDDLLQFILRFWNVSMITI